jgi:hypothetical protein
MSQKQTLGIILFGILGFCAMLALGAFLAKKVTPSKLITFAGILALVAVVCYSVFSAYYFLSGGE